MDRTRFLSLGLLILLLFLGLVPVTQAAPLAQHSREHVPQAFTAPSVGDGIPDSYELVTENDTFRLYANRSTLAFKVLDKRSGYIWHSNLDEKADGDRLNKTWTAFASSGISIDYLDSKAITERLSISNANQTTTFEVNDRGFTASVTFTDVSITIPLQVSLEAEGVRVEVLFESIRQENPDFKLGMLHVYPFFGATRTDQTPGYMFIPDGCGSLIRFTAETKAKNMFYGRYYGSDLGMLAELPWDPRINRAFKLSIPVIGMVHGEQQNAYLAIVEEGASYGEVRAHPAGIITNFNFLYNAFIYNESYFQATNRSGAGVTTIQPETNRYNIVMHYRFLAGQDSDYVGMARSYQDYLVGRGLLPEYPEPDQAIGIRLEFLAGDKEKVLFWYRTIPMTTIGQMETILSNLDVQDPQVIYYGWQPLGASRMAPHSLKIDRQLGSLDQLASLAGNITASGGSFSLYIDPIAALYNEPGYSPRNDLAMSITNFDLFGFNRNKVNYYLNYPAVEERFTALAQDISSHLEAGMALDGIGSMLFSDFKRGNPLNREEMLRAYQDLFASSPIRTSFYQPNDYLFGNASAYYDMPLGNSGYVYASEIVPFLQVILAGHVPFYGTALNFSADAQEDLLRHVDFGVYPSYFLTNEVTARILNTPSNWIYTSSYQQWGAEINTTYQWLNALLGPVEGQEILSRQVLAEGVVATTYANQMQIIVNYSQEAFSVGGNQVAARDAVILEVAP